MTTKEAVALLERYSNYDGMGITNLAGCKEAMRVAVDTLKEACPELRESEDESTRKALIETVKCIYAGDTMFLSEQQRDRYLDWLEKQKENPKTADSIPSDCVSDAKCEDRWHKVTDSLPDNGRLVLAKDCLGNVLLARYDGENWEVNVYDNEDHYCHNSISKWCEIPSEKQKEQKPWKVGANAYFTPEQKPADLSDMIVHKEPYIAPVTTPMVADEQKPAEWRHYIWAINMRFDYTALIKYDNTNNYEIVQAGNRPKQEKNGVYILIKDIKPQPSWKPSEEQMKALNETVNILAASPFLHQNDYLFNILNGLREELKKLM